MTRRRRWLRWMALALGIPLATAILSATIYVFAVPYPVALLAPAASTSLVLTDRKGEVLRTLPLANGGRAEWITIDRIPPELIDATLASEDQRFFEHSGVDIRAVGRALLLDLGHWRVISGASTMTMQLSRMVQPHEKNLRNKVREMLTAWRLERAVGKREILEQYFNRAYYGNGALGVEAASQRYFGKSAPMLGPGEAILLAVLPRAPRNYDPLLHLDAALTRRTHVMDLMMERGALSPEKRQRIEREPIAFTAPTPPHFADHFVDHVLAQLGSRTAGGVLRTTLDATLQRRLESALAEHVAGRRAQGLAQAGLVVIDPSSGAIRAMVGSADYHAPDSGQNNILTTLRHPGSSLKPFIYALAIEQGANPASLVQDKIGTVAGYHPRHQMHEHGANRFREALAGSFNLAAVEVLDRVGVSPV
ncbi:MAG TPA: transglycosylase domain-containing protein, partial [Polyangia bacterium]